MTGSAGLLPVIAVVVAAAAQGCAVIGLVRIPNTFVKVHAVSLAAAVGPPMIVLATLPFSDGGMIVRAILVAIFVLATSAVSARTMTALERKRRADEIE